MLFCDHIGITSFFLPMSCVGRDDHHHQHAWTDDLPGKAEHWQSILTHCAKPLTIKQYTSDWEQCTSLWTTLLEKTIHFLLTMHFLQNYTSYTEHWTMHCNSLLAWCDEGEQHDLAGDAFGALPSICLLVVSMMMMVMMVWWWWWWWLYW